MQSPPNPFYDPDWPALARAAQQALATARAAEAQAPLGSPAHHLALAALDAARQDAQRAQRAAFPLIADYAAWRFSNLPDAKDGFSVLPDPASFESLAAVDQACVRLLRQRQEGADVSAILLRDGQPTTLAAFADPAVLLSSWRQFGSNGPEALVSACELGEAIHLCIAHRWGGIGPNSNARYLHAASQLAQETILLRLPAAAILFRDEGYRLAANRETLRAANRIAARLVFYRHLLPGAGQREEFARVTLVWNGARCIEPDWEAEIYGSLPLPLRAALFAAPAPAPRLPGG